MWVSVVMAPRLRSSYSVVVVHGLSCSEASSWTWDGTHALYIGRHIAIHYTTREILNIILVKKKEKQAENNI